MASSIEFSEILVGDIFVISSLEKFIGPYSQYTDYEGINLFDPVEVTMLLTLNKGFIVKNLRTLEEDIPVLNDCYLGLSLPGDHHTSFISELESKKLFEELHNFSVNCLLDYSLKTNDKKLFLSASSIKKTVR